MIALLSPAKNMQQGFPDWMGSQITQPQFMEQTNLLYQTLRALAPWELESWFRINPQLAMKAACNYQDFDSGAQGTPAIFAYSGLAYTNLHAQDFDLDEILFAQDHLRILSAFYGILRPCDGILPYRLEMACKLKFEGKSLYQFWGDRLYKALFSLEEPVINLASKEYAKVITPYLHRGNKWITCDFVTYRKGKYTTLATEAKMARGQMVRYLIQNRLTQPEQLKKFDWNGYQFVPDQSSVDRYVFER